jgi:hypothetical protein
MRNKLFRLLPLSLAIGVVSVPHLRAQEAAPPEFKSHYFELCDLAVAKIENAESKGPYFVDSYAVRALCAAYDSTGRQKYLDACRQWSDRMVQYQEQMSPPGAYYMHYNRKPGQTNGDWYAADSSSIGMAVLATGVRCRGAERQRFVDSAKKFADLVIANYIKPSGGVTDGLWSKSDHEWWCSTGLFGSLSFLLYSNTGDERYLNAGLGAVNWLNGWDLTKDQPFPLSQQGPAMLMYVMECYSAGWPYIIKDDSRKAGALAKVTWCFNWITDEQQKAFADSQWPPTKGWGMKFGGLPFHEYVFTRNLPEDQGLMIKGDAGLERLEKIVFDGKPALTQLPMFMLMSYAERLNPGAIYRNAR